MKSARPAARALRVKLTGGSHGVQYYQSQDTGEQDLATRMAFLHGSSLDIAIQTAHFLGTDSTQRKDTASSESHSGYRAIMLLCESEKTVIASLGVRVEGPPLEKAYYPDILAAGDMPECTLSLPEATGFAAAVLRLSGPHEVLFGIIPADESRQVQKKAVADLCEIAVSTMRKHPREFRFEPDEKEALNTYARKFGLSTAERKRLEKAARDARIRGADAASVFRILNEAQNGQKLISELEKLRTP